MSKVIDLGDEGIIMVKFRGESYSLREPTVEDFETYQEMTKGKVSEIKAFQSWLVHLGMPEKIVRSVPLSKIKMISEGLLNSIDSKKN